jgi:hypothetical protein
MKKASLTILLCLVLMIIAPTTVLGGPNVYWHFTFKAFVDLPDTNPQEWAWVTMVEIDRANVFQDQAREARQAGGRFEGAFFAQVRAAAWRSSHRYLRDTRCHDRPAKKEVFWAESESISAYCHGMLYSSQPFRGRPGEPPARLDRFRFGFTNRKVLHENGRHEDLSSQAHVFVGPIRVEGEAREETKGGFSLQVVNYQDNLEHHRRCEDAWVEQHNTAFTHFNHNNLEYDIPPVGDYLFGQIPFGPSHKNNIVWEVHRNGNREHPHWKVKTM